MTGAGTPVDRPARRRLRAGRSGWPGLPSCALLALLIAFVGWAGGCGNTEPGVGSTGTGYAGTHYGGVTGFGSVYVEGVRYDETGSMLVYEIDPLAPREASAAELHLGMQTAVQFDAANAARRIVVRPTVVGSLESVDGDRLVVARQTILVAGGTPSPTVFDGFESPARLRIGESIEVHGHRNAAGEVEATLLRRGAPSSDASLRVSGVLAAGTEADRFAIGGLTFVRTARTRLLPEDLVPKVGDAVTIHVAAADLPAAGTSAPLPAGVIARFDHDAATQVRLSGPVTSVDGAAGTLSLAGRRIAIGQARIEGGTATEIRAGAFVRVEGRLDDTAGVAAVLASLVTIVHPDGEALTLCGTISDFVTAASFRVRNTLIDASASGVAFADTSAAQLTDGLLVEVIGRVERGVLRANQVRLKREADSRTGALRGVLEATASSVTPYAIAGTSIRLSDATVLRFGDQSPATGADLAAGLTVTARGGFVGDVFDVRELSIYRPGESQPVWTRGRADDIDLAARSLRLNAYAVRWNDGTVIVGGTDILVPGASIEVRGVVRDGVLSATRIEPRR